MNQLKVAGALISCAVLVGGVSSASADNMAPGVISAGKLAKDAEKLMGQTVTVQAEVEDVLSPNMLTLDEDAILAGPDVVVLVPAGMAKKFTHDQKVVVTGQVRRYEVAALDKEYDWFEGGKLVTTKYKMEMKTRPVLVATSIQPLNEADLAKKSAVPSISAGKLAKNSAEFMGRTVSVLAEVEDVLGPNMFTLDEDAILAGADVLVLVPAGVTASLAHDQKVTVVGKVRPYVEADLDKDYDWFENGKLVTTKTKVDWKTRPVIVAESVTTVTGTDLVRTSSK